jgi:hypothetical protein
VAATTVLARQFLRGDSLTYTDSLEAAQATTCVLPDEEGPGVMLALGVPEAP